ncbi:hypothetical protein V6Z12_A07G262500 [Gossypium hirsutum]
MDIPDVFAGFVDFIFAIKESISGLQMNNNSKSELFNSGTSDSTLLAVADFTVPIRFFGVLLVTRSPKAVDCKIATIAVYHFQHYEFLE